MRCLVVCIAALAFLSEAQAKDCAKSCKEGTDCAKACKEGEHTATERELAPFSPTTVKPPFDPKKIIAPVVGGVIGAGALAGVIAISVMKPPKPEHPKLKATPEEVLQPHVFEQKVSLLSQVVHAGANTATVVNQAGFRIGQRVILDQGTPHQEENTITGFGSLIFQNPFKFDHLAGSSIKSLPGNQNLGVGNPLLRGVVTTPVPGTETAETSSSGLNQTDALVLGGVLTLCGLVAVAGVLCMMLGGRKKTSKKRAPRETFPVPEDQQPLNNVDMQYIPAAESQYMQYMPVGLESQYMPVTPGIGAMPTMGAIPMQTMPPPTTGMYAPGFAGASPLAMNTVNALPTTAMPTAYNMGTVM